MKRRDFVRAAALAAAANALPGQARGLTWREMRSIRSPQRILRGGLVIDGTGTEPVELDVGIADGRIVALGTRLDSTGVDVIDVSGLAVAPGFVDIHSHTDLGLLVDPRAESKVRQGVTTEVTGQDGGSVGPRSDAERAELDASYRERYGVGIDFSDLQGFFRRLDMQGAAVNVASMVGAGRIRQMVIGNADRPPTDVELDRMVGLVRDALTQGACGLSSGLEYTPGGFATRAELVALTTPLRGTGLPYASHMRNEDDSLIAGIEEAIAVGVLAGVPTHISHLKAQGERNWWKAEPVLALLEATRQRAIDVSYDRYPYTAYSTTLANLFPLWSRDGGTDAFLARLADPDTARPIEAAVRDKIAQLGSWDAVQITATGAAELAAVRGRRLGELALERGTDPYRLLVDLITEDRNRTGMVGFGMSEQNTERFIAHPLGMVCSDAGALATDGPLAGGSPHPRGYGAFPRVLGHYVRERGALTLEHAIHKMTDRPARRVGLAGRGRIALDHAADLVAFDPARVRDRATFEQPHQYPEGIPYVLVAGELVIREHEHTGAIRGRALRPSPAAG
ncbi:MAG: N-acyl-D-amino-acid deacylase family protein [Longimicrobiales bacterium]